MSLEQELIRQRSQRIRDIETLGFRAYGQRFDFTHTIPQILCKYSDTPAEQLEPRVDVKISGRILTIRPLILTSTQIGRAHV